MNNEKLNSDNVKVIDVSSWITRSGCLPSRIVLWEKENNIYNQDLRFVTHIEVDNMKDEKYFVHGHYDMTIQDAKCDFKKRSLEL